MDKQDIDKVVQLIYDGGDSFWSESVLREDVTEHMPSDANAYLFVEIVDILNKAGYDLTLSPIAEQFNYEDLAAEHYIEADEARRKANENVPSTI